MNKVKYTAKLLLTLFSPVIVIVAARAVHAVYMWTLAGVVPSQELWYFALLATVVSFTAVCCYAAWRWIDG